MEGEGGVSNARVGVGCRGRNQGDWRCFRAYRMYLLSLALEVLRRSQRLKPEAVKKEQQKWGEEVTTFVRGKTLVVDCQAV